ncbi:phosphoglycerate kinase [Picrophilus oshimae]|uniref:Phosphoglycerate kinase n=1 Tax=Picrophilus torridus (strain ATCC 700027 / DSM 9790 / JCM 10055 / NBRC 100828 / KAW 2/3) TaxID=1122961 RepID=A0A8G2FWM2_PICTO|nr:phosphoglycerate kinase [Picrophilus oshimae]SMD30832.1 phosphoglycerate kinase [Picrophilus oshimae DSM 9789]
MNGSFFTMDDFDLDGKRIYLRIDINSPVNPETGEILDDSRFRAYSKTINELKSSKVVIVSHQSRPGKNDFTSLMGHARYMSNIIKKEIKFIDSLFSHDAINAISNMSAGDIIMLENSRFYSEETLNADFETIKNTHIVRRLSPLFDYYVIDAFPAIHRAQTTLIGFKGSGPNIAGRLMEREITMLDKFKFFRGSPKIAILAGSKIEDSIKVSRAFLKDNIVDYILTGGVVANAFLYAGGFNIGRKNREFIIKNNDNYESLINSATQLLQTFRGRILMPDDFLLSPSGRHVTISESINDDEIIADIGFNTVDKYSKIISRASAIFMNGPMGIYEIPEYSIGTREVFNIVAETPALKIAGGGHTLNALNSMHLTKKMDYTSTGGGALINYLSGDSIPVIDALIENKRLFGGKYNGR